MIYKFKSKAAGDVVMLGPNGDQLLRALGREPAAQGIIEVAAMPAAIAALERAVAEEEARGRPADKADAADAESDPGDERAARGVGLRARVWPMVEMMRRSQAAGEPIVWGV
jgi:hypothetical protein